MEFWSEEFEKKVNRTMEKKHACLYDISTKAFSCIADRRRQLSFRR